MATRKYPPENVIGLRTDGVKIARHEIRDFRREGEPPADCDHRSSAPGRPLLNGTFCKLCGTKIRSTIEDDAARERYNEKLHESMSPRRGEERW